MVTQDVLPPTRAHATVGLLAAIQGLYQLSSILNFTFIGLVGVLLAPTPELATLPVALVTGGAALTTVPASLFMRRFGRRAGFILGGVAGMLNGLCGVGAVLLQSYGLLLAAGFFLGVYGGLSLYLRYAAAEATSGARRGRAISLVLTGGVAAALLAPYFSAWGRGLVPVSEYAGVFVLTAVCALLSLLPAVFLRVSVVQESEADKAGARPLLEIARQPVFIAAVTNAAAGYGLMVLIMTATPLAMSHHEHLHIAHTEQVIQWHVLAMFVPSFFTGSMIGRFGAVPILWSGMGLFLVCAVAALTGVEFGHFAVALIALGVGWNFLYVGGTTLMLDAFTPAERTKTLALNEVLVFGANSLAALSSGAVLHYMGWNVLTNTIFPILLLSAMATLWHMRTRP